MLSIGRRTTFVPSFDCDITIIIRLLSFPTFKVELFYESDFVYTLLSRSDGDLFTCR